MPHSAVQGNCEMIKLHITFREVRVANLKKRRLWGDLVEAFHFL